MKNYALRILVGVIAFLIGISAVLSWTLMNTQTCFVIKQNERVESVPAPPKSGKIEVYYKGFTKDDSGVIKAEFEIINGSSNTLYYRSIAEGVDYISSVSLNKKEGRRIGYCGDIASKMKDISFESGKSVSFKLPLNRFWEFASKSKKQDFRVGFPFTDHSGKYETFWTEEFQLPMWVQEAITNS